MLVEELGVGLLGEDGEGLLPVGMLGEDEEEKKEMTEEVNMKINNG